jgi:hypothetical protein
VASVTTKKDAVINPALMNRGVYTPSVSSHTFRRARHGRRFLCRKIYIPETEYDEIGLGKLTLGV